MAGRFLEPWRTARRSVPATFGGQIRLRIALVLTIALLQGIALSLAGRFDRNGMFLWWIAPPMLMTVLSTGIVLGSLLVVRSCGYRLVPKAAAVG